jgi:hypothetical protein
VLLLSYLAFLHMPSTAKSSGPLVSHKTYILMFVLAVLLLALGELPFFDQHRHWQMFIREVALALVVAVPIWFIALRRKLKIIGAFIAKNAYYFMLALAVVLLAASELRFFEPHPHWQIFVKEIAFALIIATLFGFTVERYQRQEFVKLVNKERDDLKRDIFVYAYGHEIGDQIREAMKADVLKCAFQKENLRMGWEFSEISGDGDHVLVRKQQIYTLRNTTALNQTFTFRFSQFSASEQDVLLSREFEILKVKLSSGPQQFTEDQLTYTALTPHQRILTKGFDLGPNEQMEVFFSHKETRLKFGDDSWESIHPVVGTTEVTFLVNEPLCFEISAVAKGSPIDTTAPDNPPRRFEFRLKSGLLPYQGLAFSWSPNKAKNEQKRDAPVKSDNADAHAGNQTVQKTTDGSRTT